MSTDLTSPGETQGAGAFDANNEAMARYLGLNPSKPADQAVVAVAQHYGLDPLLKHVVVIPGGGVYVTRDGLLHVAHRSGQLDGIVVDQEPTLVEKEWVARVSVYRKDMGHPFTFPGRYPVGRGNKEYAAEMALKAAEAHALRRAFDINGLPALDERRPDGAATRGRSAADVLASADDDTTTSYDNPPDSPSDDAPAPITDRTRKHVFALLGDLGITDATQQRAGMSQVLGRKITTRTTLTEDDGRALVIDLEARKAGRTEEPGAAELAGQEAQR